MEYKRNLTETEVKILLHDLLDIKAWVDMAIEGKINNCLTRVANEYRQLQLSRGIVLPVMTNLECFDAYLKDPNYKNRKQRDKFTNKDLKG